MFCLISGLKCPERPFHSSYIGRCFVKQKVTFGLLVQKAKPEKEVMVFLLKQRKTKLFFFIESS